MRGALAVLLVLGALVAACSPNDPPGGEGRLSIATGGAGGVYQVYGGGLADLLSDELPDSPTTAETTSASVDNLLLVANGDSDIAFALEDSAIDAVRGQESFGEPLPLKALGTLYPNITQVVVKADSGHRVDRGHEGQDDLGRVARLRHRGDRAAAAGGRRRRRRRGHHQAPARRGGVRAGAARRVDRRVLLVRRRPDRRGHRPGDHRRHPPARDRPVPRRAARASSATPTRRRRSRRAGTRASRAWRRSACRTC